MTASLASFAVLCIALSFTCVLADPDLPGHVSPTETLDALTLLIPMDLTYQGQGMTNQYAPNGTRHGPFNMRAYGLVNALLWADVPVKWIIKNNKAYDEPDFCASTWERFPTNEQSEGANPANRCFRAGPYAIPTSFTTVAEAVMSRYINDPAYNYGISYVVLSNGTKQVTITTGSQITEKRVRVYRLAAPVDVNVRYTLYTRPYAAVLDSSKYFDVEARNLLAAGFIPGRHFTVMTKDEAYKFDGNTCVTFATEPHFLINQPGQDDPINNKTIVNGFVNAVRKFVTSGGNFLAQCGGLSTYEQCDNIRPDGTNGRSCPPTSDATVCPDGYFLSTRGLFFPRSNPSSNCPGYSGSSSSRTPFLQDEAVSDWTGGAPIPVKISHPDLPINQFDGSWDYEYGEVAWFSLWKTTFTGTAYGAVDSDWKSSNFAHPLVEAADRQYSRKCSKKREVVELTEAEIEARSKKQEQEDELRHEVFHNMTMGLKRQAGACSTMHAFCDICNMIDGCRYCKRNNQNQYECRNDGGWSNPCSSSSWGSVNTCPMPATPVPPLPSLPDCAEESMQGIYFSAHGKLGTQLNKNGANVFYISGHEYDNSNGRRLFMNAVMHPSARSANCTVMVPQCDANGQNCHDVPKNFYIDPCAYVLPNASRANLTNVTIPPATLARVDSAIASDMFDNPSPLLKDTTIVPTCPMRICITYLESTRRHDSFGYLTWNTTTNQIISQVTIFPDLENSTSCIQPGNTLCYGPFAPGTAVGWWVAVGSIYSPAPRYVYSLDPNGLPTSNFIKFGLDGYTFLAFSSTSSETDPYNELLFGLSFETTGTCPPPTVIVQDEPCFAFNPNLYTEEWFKSSCIDFVPLNVGQEQCGTPVEIPDGWIISPVDDDFNNVLSTYSNNWPAGCYQGTTDAGYGSFNGCTPTHVTYTTFINSAGQVCIRSDCSDHLLLQHQTVDTRCHPDNYDQFCDRADPSTVFDDNSLMPGSIFVNLIDSKPVTYDVNPGLPPKMVQIMFLMDVNNLAAVRVATTYFRNYILQALNTLPTGLDLYFGYAWSDGVLRGGQFLTIDKTNIQYWSAPTCSQTSGCTNRNILSVLSTLAASTSVGWEPTNPHHRIVVVMTGSDYLDADLNPTLVKRLSDNNITPLFITLSNLVTRYTAIRTQIPWAVVASPSQSSWPDPIVSTPQWVAAFAPGINTIRTQITAFIDKDYYSTVSRTGINSLSLTFQDRTFTATPSTSPYPIGHPTRAPGTEPYNYPINVCSFPNFPGANGEALQYTQYWSYSTFADNSVLGTCDCAESPVTPGTPLTVAQMRTRSVSIMNLPADTHAGPVIRVFGRPDRQVYVTVARPPTYALPEMNFTLLAGSTFPIEVYSNPSTIYGALEHKVYVEVQYVENGQYLTTLNMLDGTPATDFDPELVGTGPYEVCDMSPSKGFNVRADAKYCKLSDGSVPRGKVATWGESNIYYRFCDGCLCAAGPVSLRGGAIVKLTFTCPPQQPPVCEDLTFRVLPGQTIPVSLTANISDPDDPKTELFVRYTALPTRGTLTGSTGSALDAGSWLLSSQNVRFTADQSSADSFATYQVQDPYGGTSATCRINFLPYHPPEWTVTPFLIAIPREVTGNFSFSLRDVDSDTLTFDIAALERLNIPTPSTFTFSGPGGSVNILTIDPDTEIAVIPNPNPGDIITVHIFWTADITLPDGSRGTFITTLTDTEGLTANPLTLTVRVLDFNQSPNEPPYGTDPPLVTTQEDVNKNFSIVASDPDWYQQTSLNLSVVSLPTHGKLYANTPGGLVPVTTGTLLTVTVPGPNSTSSPLLYDPDPNYHGNDSFNFIAIDSIGVPSAFYLVNIVIEAEDDPPSSHDITIVVKQNTCILPAECPNPSVNFNTTTITGDDIDGDPICLVIDHLPENGTLVYYDSDDDTWYAVTTNQTFCDSDRWVFSYQPPHNNHSQFDDVPFVNFSYHVTSNGENSPPYNGTIIVTHVNQPPTSAPYTNSTEMNVPITFSLPHDDLETPDDLTLVPVDIVFGTRGVFTFADSGEPVVPGVGVFNTWDITFSPDLNVYSDPETTPIGIMTYKVVDPEGLESGIFTARIFISFTALEIAYKNDTEIIIDEDTSISFYVDRFGIDWFGGNEGYQTVSLTATNFAGNGSLAVCVAGTSNCNPISLGSDIVVIPPGSQLRFIPVPNEFGPDYYSFDLTLDPVTDAQNVTVTYTITVNPINDPPTLVARFSTSREEPNSCDEDTYLVIEFEAHDIDSPMESLQAKFITFLDQQVANSLYRCDDNTCEPATHGSIVTAGTTWSSAAGDAVFYLLFVPNPNVNGETRFLLSVLDDYNAESSAVVAPITVLPVNDPPAFDELDADWDVVSKRALAEENISISGRVSDIDFRFGYNVGIVIYSDPANGAWTDIGTTEVNCTIDAGNNTVVCVDDITEINRIFGGGFLFQANSTVDVFEFSLLVNDLANIDHYGNENETYATITVNRTAVVALAAKPPAVNNNAAFIAAPIAALLGAALIAALVLIIRKQAAAKVGDYFDRMALDMAGSANSSPLYQGATKGGESPLYKG